MAVGSGVPYNAYTGNGVTTVFAYGFTLLNEDDLLVTINGTVTSSYTVSGVGVAAGGSITFSSAPANGAAVLLQRVIQLVRDAEYQTDGDLQANTLNADFDRLWIAVQQNAAIAERSIRAPVPETLTALPASASRLGLMPYFDASTGDVALSTFTATQVASAVAAAYGTGSTADAVTFLPAGSGAVSRTVQAKLRELVSVFDFIPVAEHAAIQAGTSTYDCTDDLADAFTASAQLHFPPGTYRVNPSGYPTKRAILNGSADNVVIWGYGATLKWLDGLSVAVGVCFIELTNSDRVLIAGLKIDGNKSSTTGGYTGISMFGGSDIVIRDVTIDNTNWDGLYFRGSTVATLATYPTRVLLDNVHTSRTGRNGLSVIGANGFTILGGSFNTSDGDPGAGIDVEPNVSDIHGVRGFKAIGVTVSGNDGRGFVITGNAAGSPGETPFCLDAEITGLLCNGNSGAQNASIGGCDVYVTRCPSFVMTGYRNVNGETQNPMDAGLVYIDDTVEHATIDGFEVKDCAFPTDTKSIIFLDSGNEPHRTVRNGRISDCSAVGVSGGKYSLIENIVCEDVTGDRCVIAGTTDSSLRNITAIRSGYIQAYNTSGTGAYAVDGLTIIDPVAPGLRLYQQGSSVRNVVIRHSGTPATQAVWLESITDCNLSGFSISDAGGYWDTPSNAYLVTQSSLSGNRIRDMVPALLGGSKTWDPPSIADGAATSTTVSLLRADVGDACRVSNSISLAGLIQFASVTSANTATVTLFNKTGGAVDLASHTVTVEALK